MSLHYYDNYPNLAHTEKLIVFKVAHHNQGQKRSMTEVLIKENSTEVKFVVRKKTEPIESFRVFFDELKFSKDILLTCDVKFSKYY